MRSSEAKPCGRLREECLSTLGLRMVRCFPLAVVDVFAFLLLYARASFLSYKLLYLFGLKFFICLDAMRIAFWLFQQIAYPYLIYV